MPHTCQIMVQAFLHPDWNVLKGDGYEDYDLECGIINAEDLLAAGYTLEPMDGFNLREFIAWAKASLLASS